MKKIYIADILSSEKDGKCVGHYFSLARNYQSIFKGQIVIAGGPIYKTGFEESELLLLPWNSGGLGLKGRLRTFANALKLFKAASNNIIILQQCTTITTFLCIALFYHRKSKLYLIQYSREGFRLKIGKFLFLLAKHKIDGIICPNDMVGKSFEGIPYCVVPDYIYTNDKRPEPIPYKSRKYDFCILGRISPEKGVPDIARYFANSPFNVIIAGQPQTEALGLDVKNICYLAKNIELHLDYISDKDYYYYLQNSKFAILNYSEEYSERSSGVVLDTIYNGTPVIGKRCRSLQFIDDYKLGLVYDEISNIDFDLIMSEDFHQKTLANIDEYCKGMKKYIEKLHRFVLKNQE